MIPFVTPTLSLTWLHPSLAPPSLLAYRMLSRPRLIAYRLTPSVYAHLHRAAESYVEKSLSKPEDAAKVIDALATVYAALVTVYRPEDVHVWSPQTPPLPSPQPPPVTERGDPLPSAHGSAGGGGDAADAADATETTASDRGRTMPAPSPTRPPKPKAAPKRKPADTGPGLW